MYKRQAFLRNPSFACLPVDPEDGGGTREPLGLARALYRLPSVPLQLWLARRPPRARGEPERDLYLVAAPLQATELGELWPGMPELPLLPFGEEEQEQLTGAYGEGRALVRTGPSASHETLAALAPGTTRTLQFVAHGAFLQDEDHERGACIILAPADGFPDGLLWCDDVEQLTSPAELVVLTACGSARGPQRIGDDGVAHLGGAFLIAGARAVVVAKSDVEYYATLDLMEVFHRRLSEGASPAQALRDARRELAATPGREHPFYHSLIQVLGLGTEPLFPERPEDDGGAPPWPWLAGGLVLLAGSLVWVRTRRSTSA